MNITLIRHGKTKSNINSRYLGKTNEPLAREGEEKLKELISSKLYPEVKKIYVSPMLRCLQTAQLIYPIIRPEIIEDLREISFGQFEGLTHEEIIKNPDYADYADLGVSVKNFYFPDGEDVLNFSKRCVNAFLSIADTENIAIITHGGVIMSIMFHLFIGDIYSYQVDNGEGYVLFDTDGGLSYRKLL